MCVCAECGAHIHARMKRMKKKINSHNNTHNAITRYTDINIGGRLIDRVTSPRLSVCPSVYAFFGPFFLLLFFFLMCIGHSSLDRTLDCFQRRCLPILLSIVLNCFLAGVFVAAGTSHRQRPLSAAFAAVDRAIDRSIGFRCCHGGGGWRLCPTPLDPGARHPRPRHRPFCPPQGTRWR